MEKVKAGLLVFALCGVQLIVCRPGGERGVCDDVTVSCACGGGNSTIDLSFEQCRYNHAGNLHCLPCDDVHTESVCDVFRHCSSCSDVGCTSCLPGLRGATCQHEVLPCPLVDVPQHGHVAYGEQIQRATYSCDEGFELLGAKVRDCLDSGEWTDMAPSCERTCLLPASFRHGYVETLGMIARAAAAPMLNHHSLTFGCNQEYELVGPRVVTCLPSGEWSSVFPRCVRSCHRPEVGHHTRILGDRYTEGSSVWYKCEFGYDLVGSAERNCMPNGSWTGTAPRCETAPSCDDPGLPVSMQRLISGPRKSIFLEGATVKYECSAEQMLVGSTARTCQNDGSWSGKQPRCVLVFQDIVTCTTTGADVVRHGSHGIPVRIRCPPGCATDAIVWGTGIYNVHSHVCGAALHAGLLTATGGATALVVSNGRYSHYVGSHLHGIQSLESSEIVNSFRFEEEEVNLRHTKLAIVGNDLACPAGWQERLPGACVRLYCGGVSWDEAYTDCVERGTKLFAPDSEDTNLVLTELLQEEQVTQVWTGLSLHRGQFAYFDGTDRLLNGSAFTAWAPHEPDSSGHCVLFVRDGLWRDAPCSLQLPFVCVRSLDYDDSVEEEVFCPDPGRLENGGVSPDFRNRDYVPGARLYFSCDEVYYLKGAGETTCGANGEWMDEKPECVRVKVCSHPGNPGHGIVSIRLMSKPTVVTMRPQRGRYEQLISLSSSRSGRPPLALMDAESNAYGRTSADWTAMSAESHSQQQGEWDAHIPDGYYRANTRMHFACVSGFYKLVGSETRTCLSSGQWTGIQPTCLPVCGKSSAPRTPYIVNGITTKKGEWPWQAGISRYHKFKWQLDCGGALLSENLVVTAAHCVTMYPLNVPLPQTHIRVSLGKFYRNDSHDDDEVQRFAVEEIRVHREYNPANFNADIALLRLKRPARLTYAVQPVCLPTNHSLSTTHLSQRSVGVVTGWGRDENNAYPSALQQTRLAVVSNQDCEKAYTADNLKVPVTDYMFCAGYGTEMSDSCNGDSGGPMVFSVGSGASHHWVLEGIVSWGSPKGCAIPSHYGGYTRVERFVDWIAEYL